MKNCHAEEFICPEKCIQAVKKLRDLGNPFYQGIEINENFLDNIGDNSQDDMDDDLENERSDSDESDDGNEVEFG